MELLKVVLLVTVARRAAAWTNIRCMNGESASEGCWLIAHGSQADLLWGC